MSNPVAGPPAPPLAEIGDTVVAKGAVISNSVCGCGARASEWRVARIASAAIAVPKTTGKHFFISGRLFDGLDASFASFSILLARVSNLFGHLSLAASGFRLPDFLSPARPLWFLLYFAPASTV
jgi:hypothetical protein